MASMTLVSPRGRGAAHTRVPLSPSRRRLLLGCAVVVSLTGPFIAASSRSIDSRISELCPTGAAGLLWLMVVWHSPRHRLLPVAGIGLATVVAGLMAQMPLTAALCGALAAGLQPWLMSLGYLRLKQDPGWGLARWSDLWWLLVTGLVTCALQALVGGLPGIPPGEIGDSTAWWTVRLLAFLLFGTLPVLTFVFAPRPSALPSGGAVNLVVLVAVAALSVSAAFAITEMPLSWLAMVPTVWGGLTLRPRANAGLVLWVGLMAATVPLVVGKPVGYTGLVAWPSVFDLMMVASGTAGLLLSMMREDNARLLAERDTAAQVAEARHHELASVLSSMNDGVLVVDDSGIIFHNAGVRRLLRQPLPQGPVVWSRLLPRDADGNPTNEDRLRSLLTIPEHQTQVTVRIGPAGDPAWMEVVAQRLNWRGRAATLVLIHDLTDAHARMQDLRNFAGTVAHDLRGPLTNLIGWVELAEDTLPPETPTAVSDALARADAAGERMRQVIEDWLAYTVVRGSEPRPEVVTVSALAAEVVNGRVGSDPNGPRMDLALTHSVRADPAMLRQVLDNLVGNALKYTRPGVPARVSMRSVDDEEPGWVRIEVVDEGIGVPAGEEESIFDEFHRGSGHGGYQGTGLGLSLSRTIVRRHGGDLTARRNPEHGSTFAFTLPQG